MTTPSPRPSILSAGSALKAERQADLLEDIASALDAGLSPETILTGPSTATLSKSAHPAQPQLQPQPQLQKGLVGGLVQKGLPLSQADRCALEAAESSGCLPRALRQLAEKRKLRAALLRQTYRRLAYPLSLLVFGLCIFAFTRLLFGGTLSSFLWTGGLFLFLGLLAYLFYRRLGNPACEGRLVPGLRDLLWDLGELPYLQTMHGLYGAGVKLQEAHPLATTGCPVPWVRHRLLAADYYLQRGEPLVDALARSQAVCPETLQTLGSAEVAGELESALKRAGERRHHTMERRLRLLLKAASLLISLLVYGYCAWVILSFYGDYYGNLAPYLR